MSAPLCISYIRFSKKTQLEGSSLERQLDRSRKWAAEHGWHLDDTLSYQDLGKSAYSADHVKSGKLGDLLNLIRGGRIPAGSVLLVESLDRLSRVNVMDAFAQFTEIINEGINIVTLKDEKEYSKTSLSSNMSDMIISISIMMRAYEESELKSDRIRVAYEKKRNKLHTEKQTQNCPQWLTLSNDRSTFHVIEERAAVVRRIFSMSYDGTGIKTIVRILNEEGVPASKSTTGWCQSSVRKILSNRAVIGEFQPRTSVKGTKQYVCVGEPIVGYFPRIIEDEIFNAVQARITNGSHRAGRTAKVENLFGGITKCGYCGARMDVVSKGKFPNEVRYLVCDNARRGVGSCNYLGLKCNEVEDAFMEFCRESGVIDLLNSENEQEKAASLELARQVSALEGELLRVVGQIKLNDEESEETEDKLERDHIRSRLRRYLYAKDGLEKELAAKKAEIERINQSRYDSETKVEGILSLFKSAQRTMDENERVRFRMRLRNDLRQMVEKVIVYPRGRVYSDSQVQQVLLRYSQEEAGLDDTELKAHAEIRDAEVADMKATQTNTKKDRLFTVYFKNGNYRTFKFSPDSNRYVVVADRMGNRVDWTMRGKPMKPIILEDTALVHEEAIAHLRAKYPDESFTDEEVESIRELLRYEEGEFDGDTSPR